MNTLYTIKRNLLALPLAMLAMAMATSCEEDAIVRSNGESPYTGITEVKGQLIDKDTRQNSSVVEMRGDEYTANVTFKLSTPPQKGVDIKVAVDEAYATTYNELHGTDFGLFPSANVSIANDGVFLLAPDEQTSPEIGVTLTAFEGMEEDRTYIVPLTVTSVTEGITLAEDAQHMALLVKDCRNMPTTDKGPDAVKTVLYFEVNDVNPLNALEFKTESGKYFFDHVVLFAANINWDAARKRVYVYNNANVQFLLDNNEQYLQPLRKAGMKVIISILGNHDEAGVAQLSDWGAREFAKELAAYCNAYNLDGVAFDDEYSLAPDLSNPWLAEEGIYAGSRLMYECKAAMPDKIVSLYNLGNIFSNKLEVIDGIKPGQYCDYAVADYGREATPGIGMTLKQCGGMSVELSPDVDKGTFSTSSARRVKENGYGYFMFFNLNPKYYNSDGDNNSETRIEICQSVCKGLYEEELIAPTYYYEKNSTERKPL